MQGTRRIWLHLLSILLVAAGTVSAQEIKRGANSYTLPAGSMPAWTVPVLRLVSATHVEPTTGVILSDSGLVLIPEDFASMGDEIIVLDGGTDIIRNGRPARIEKKFMPEGLQVLSVQGLKRKGVTLAAAALQEGDSILLAAFPPAELIAQGEPPLSIPASVVVFSNNGTPAISGETGLPNVTGALVDSCGNLVGVSLADDVQSMEVSTSTRYQWRDTLLQVFAQMGISLREFDCADSAKEAAPEPEPEIEEPVVKAPVAEDASEPEPESAEESLPEPEEDLPLEDTQEMAEEEPLLDTLPPMEEDVVASPEAEDDSGTGGGLWLLAAIILFGLGLMLHRLRQSGKEGKEAEKEGDDTGPGAITDSPEDDLSASEPALDSRLLIEGVLADGTAIEDSCAVSKNAINVVIGRAGADLVIDSPAVSRKHASINGTYSELTVSDLGSSNGTSINGVPCLDGEIMFIEPGDILIMGDARCSLEIRPRNTTGSEKE